MINHRLGLFVVFTAIALAAFVVGYAFAGLDDPAALVIAVTAPPQPAPTLTAVVSLPTPVPTEAPIIVSLPDCSADDTPRGSLCTQGNVAYGECDPDAPISREPCYKP